MTNDEKLKNNNYFIDNLKVILIFLVVFGHLIERYIDTNSTLLGVYMFIYIFHMPLFIFVSGFLSKNIYKSRNIFFESLLIPYIVLNIVWYLLAYLYTGKFMIPIIYPGWTLWFLLSLFFWRISLRYLVKIQYILPISFILGILVGFVPNGSILSFSRTFVFLPYFLMGYFADMKKLKTISDKINISIGGAIIGAVLFLSISFYLSENSIINYKLLYGSYSFNELGLNMYLGILHRGILYISSIVLSLFICEITPRKKTFYSNIGKSTMYVYTFHIYIILLIFYFIPKWNISYITNWIILLSPILITYILSRKYIVNSYNFIFNKITKLIIR